MSTAPRDGTLIRLLRSGGTIVGYWSQLFEGWADWQEQVPLIRGSAAFTGWEPVDQDAAHALPRKRGPERRVVRVMQ